MPVFFCFGFESVTPNLNIEWRRLCFPIQSTVETYSTVRYPSRLPKYTRSIKYWYDRTFTRRIITLSRPGCPYAGCIVVSHEKRCCRVTVGTVVCKSVTIVFSFLVVFKYVLNCSGVRDICGADGDETRQPLELQHASGRQHGEPHQGLA